MAIWNNAHEVPHPPRGSHTSEPEVAALYDYVKKLANIVASTMNDLEFILNGNIDAKNIRAESIETRNLKADSITSEKIQTGSITTDKLHAGAVTAEKIEVDELSAISANLGHILAGLMEAVTIMSKPDGEYPRVLFDSLNNVFMIEQDADNRIVFNPSALGTPSINFHSGSIDGYVGYFNNLHKLILASPDGADVELSNGGLSGSIRLSPVDFLYVPDWSDIKNNVTGQTLQQALDASSGYTGSVHYVAGVDLVNGVVAYQTMTFQNGLLKGVS